MACKSLDKAWACSRLAGRRSTCIDTFVFICGWFWALARFCGRPIDSKGHKTLNGCGHDRRVRPVLPSVEERAAISVERWSQAFSGGGENNLLATGRWRQLTADGGAEELRLVGIKHNFDYLIRTKNLARILPGLPS